MKSVKFWKMAAKELSMTEQIFYRDAIKTLFAWEVLRDEYPDLDLIMRILESEVQQHMPRFAEARVITG